MSRADLADVKPAPWMKDALCKPGFTELPIEIQRAVCRRCPVAGRCAVYGLEDPVVQVRSQELRRGPSSRYVYGGLDLDELRAARADIESSGGVA